MLLSVISSPGVQSYLKMRRRMRYTILETLSRVGKKGQNKFPVYKNRSGRCSYQADNGAGTVEVYEKRINLPKIGWIRMREELQWTGEITKVVVSRHNNKWFASITVRRLDSNNYKHQPLLFDDKHPIRHRRRYQYACNML